MKGIWSIKDAKIIIKIIFISFEFLFAIIMFAVYFLNIVQFNNLGFFLFNDIEIVKWITIGMPITLFIAALKLKKILLQPEHNNKILYNWPDYKYYSLTTNIAVIFCFLPIPPTIISWIGFDLYNKHDIGFYYVLLNGISIISLVSLHFSSYEIKRVLQKNI